jgi:transcriptional regulator with XRE-family HTH domain
MTRKYNTFRATREFIGLNQQELAELLVVSRAYISILEMGRRDMPS